MHMPKVSTLPVLSTFPVDETEVPGIKPPVLAKP